MTTVTKTVKAVNYTAEQTEKMVSAYAASKTEETVKALALEMGKSVRSIVAKLSREKVYVAKTYKTKTGAVVVKKDELADKIGAALGMKESDIESLTKVTKPALMAILAAVMPSEVKAEVFSD